MRHLSILMVFSFVALMSGSAQARFHAPHRAQLGHVHRGPCSGNGAYADGRVVWCSRGRHQVASPVVWSRRHDAVAFATRDSRGYLSLRVAFVSGQFRGTLLSWSLGRPQGGEPLSVMWLGTDRVGIGKTEVRPSLVASWRLSNT